MIINEGCKRLFEGLAKCCRSLTGNSTLTIRNLAKWVARMRFMSGMINPNDANTCTIASLRPSSLNGAVTLLSVSVLEAIADQKRFHKTALLLDVVVYVNSKRRNRGAITWTTRSSIDYFN